MVTLLKKAVFTGLGIVERTCEILDDLAKKGEANQAEIAKRLKALFEQGEHVEVEVKQKINDLAKRLCCSIPSRADLERFEKELADLAAQVRQKG